MGYERLWERLLEFLQGLGSATETAPGRIQVTLAEAAGPRRSATIVMTRDEWDDMVTIPWGDFDHAADQVRSALLALGDNERFLVYDLYELVPSTTPELPPDPDEQKLDEFARQHPDDVGRWMVTDDDGNNRDAPEPPPE